VILPCSETEWPSWKYTLGHCEGNVDESIYTHSRALCSSSSTFAAREKESAKNQAQSSQTKILGHAMQAYICVMPCQRNHIHIITDSAFMGQFNPHHSVQSEDFVTLEQARRRSNTCKPWWHVEAGSPTKQI